MKTITTKQGVKYALLDNGTVERNIPGTNRWEQQISLIPEVREALGIIHDWPSLVIAKSGALDRIWQIA